ncbi:MAG: hypothetical protein E5299_00569 [Burkholderia gladioli]|nr:MAG: hypothetical protein E5299_00569 [Burkholderia gladioli]
MVSRSREASYDALKNCFGTRALYRTSDVKRLRMILEKRHEKPRSNHVKVSP